MQIPTEELIVVPRPLSWTEDWDKEGERQERRQRQVRGAEGKKKEGNDEGTIRNSVIEFLIVGISDSAVTLVFPAWLSNI